MGKSSRSGRRTLGPRRLSARAPASRWLREFTASYSTQLRRSPRCSRPVTEIRTRRWGSATGRSRSAKASRSEEHTSELQSRQYLVCRLLLEKKQQKRRTTPTRKASHVPGNGDRGGPEY